MPTRRPDRRGSAASRGYDETWRRLRAWHLAANPLCAYCRQADQLTLAEVVDHIKPFDGVGDPLRLDPGNLQSLCKRHHDGAKQALDKSGVMRGCDARGVPLDAGHHWAKRTG